MIIWKDKLWMQKYEKNFKMPKKFKSENINKKKKVR